MFRRLNRQLILRLGLAFGATLTGLAGTEGILRLTERRPLFDLLTLSDQPGLVYEYRTNVRVGAEFLEPEVDKRGRAAGFHPVPGDYAINNLGFRDAKMGWDELSGPGAVLCLGDSTTYGLTVPLERTYPKELENRLRRAFPGRPVRVLNAGVWGYNLEQLEANARRLLSKIRPRTVVLGIFMNDNEPLPPGARAMFWLKEHSRLVNNLDRARRAWNERSRDFSEETLLDRLESMTDPGTARALAEGIRFFGGRRDQAISDANRLWAEGAWRKSFDSLDAIADLCRDRGVVLRVLVFPNRDQLLPGYTDPRPQAWIMDRCASRGIFCRDMTPTFRDAFRSGKPLYTYANDNAHFSAIGHALIADALDPFLRRDIEAGPQSF